MDKKILEFGTDILRSERFQTAKQVKHHKKHTVADHSIRVAECALRMGDALKKKGIKVEDSDLVRGALLHDIGMTEEKVHESVSFVKCFTHPRMGARIAEREYGANKVQRNSIRRHMWPACIIPPLFAAGWIILAADKYCSVKELRK